VIKKIIKVLAILVGIALLAFIGFLIFMISIFGGMSDPLPRTKEHLGREFTNIHQLYPDSTLQHIVKDLTFMNRIFQCVPEVYDTRHARIGYEYSQDTLYYSHCYDDRGQYFSIKQCNIDSVFQDGERYVFYEKADFLKCNYLDGYRYASVLNTGILRVHMGDFEDWRDYRDICLSSEIDTAFVRRTHYVVIDSQQGLTLLGSKNW
jgi:hypothetical protein